MSFSLSLVGLIHEVMENGVVLDSQDIDHIVKLEIIFIQIEQSKQLVIAVIQNLVQELVQVELDNAPVLLENFILLRPILVIILRREQNAKVIDE